MLHRIFTGVIVCFWLVMTSQLIRLQVNPDRSDLLVVPPSHVFKLMFTHEQTSELDIVENGSPIGNISLNPKTDPALDKRSLDFSGSLLFHLPNTPKAQRVSWNGTWETDNSYKTSNLHLTLNLLPVVPHDPTFHLHLDFDPASEQVEYEYKEGDQSVRKSTVTANIKGAISLLRDEFGVDPSFLQNMPRNIEIPTLTAKQTAITVHAEKTVVYLLTVKQGEIVVAEIYVSQLGQILAAKTIFGYTFRAPDMLPPS